MQALLQLALDFFAPTADPASAFTDENFGQNRPLALIPSTLKAPESGAKQGPGVPVAPTATLFAPTVFRHPQARRELRLGDAIVGYALVRARRRSIGFSVGVEGLSVRAPQAVTLAAIDSALLAKADWIVRKLGETRERNRRQQHAQIVWRDGVQLPYLGQLLGVRLDPAAPVVGRLVALPDALPTLHLGLPLSATPQQMRDTVQAWLGRSARAHFTQRLDHFAPSMGVRWQRLALTNARTRWGSARSDGSIRLNWRLMHFAPEVLDYVVVHELAHLRVMDHSPRFWAEVAAVLPNYAQLRQRLREETAPNWDTD
ncbi:MAG: M48 family metallopeptidase [Simplicispira suum]|uniref:M48 family metallopeptidase n=1 Tax=Simplicispira suum TaxID=2109915 RepID=UPI001C6BDBFB|nr:SprT family zinc-dependent metalloprotease [Simplicispira suum]MBW7832867.1 M48 family metallopeptidase [Simplicispira suum]